MQDCCNNFVIKQEKLSAAQGFFLCGLVLLNVENFEGANTYIYIHFLKTSAVVMLRDDVPT